MISLIVAIGRNRAIGLNNKMPWYLPADLAYFKKVTTGHAILMGRKTFESIGKPLPNRTNIVLTKNESYHVEGCHIIHSIDEVKRVGENEELFVIGGADIYKQLLPGADRIYLTLIHNDFEADTFFPELGEEWTLVSTENHLPDEKNQFEYEFQVYEKSR